MTAPSAGDPLADLDPTRLRAAVRGAWDELVEEAGEPDLSLVASYLDRGPAGLDGRAGVERALLRHPGAIELLADEGRYPADLLDTSDQETVDKTADETVDPTAAPVARPEEFDRSVPPAMPFPYPAEQRAAAGPPARLPWSLAAVAASLAFALGAFAWTLRDGFEQTHGSLVADLYSARKDQLAIASSLAGHHIHNGEMAQPSAGLLTQNITSIGTKPCNKPYQTQDKSKAKRVSKARQN